MKKQKLIKSELEEKGFALCFSFGVQPVAVGKSRQSMKQPVTHIHRQEQRKPNELVCTWVSAIFISPSVHSPAHEVMESILLTLVTPTLENPSQTNLMKKITQ